MKKIISFIFLLSFQFSLIAQVDSTKLNQLFKVYEAKQKALLSMCISEKGTVIYSKSIGVANPESGFVANEHTLYHIGSITKMFTAVMVFQLIEEKKVLPDTKLKTFFPTLPNCDKITISTLLNHRSGLFNFTDDSLYTSYMEKKMSQDAMISIFEKQAPEFEPDTKASYSNTNYVLLGYIIEKITGHTYNEELANRICKKAKLTETKVPSFEGEQNMVKSFQFKEGHWERSTETNMSVPGGAGAIVSTPSDLCRFIECLFDGKLISEASFKEMKTIRDNYGKGIFQIPFGARKGYGHTGGIDDFQSVLGYFPDDKIAFCVLSNGLNYVMNDISIAVLSIYYKVPYKIPTFEKAVLSPEELKTFEGNYNCSSIGMKITIKKDGDRYTAQATGQGAFPLDKVSDLEYKFDAAGVRIFIMKDKEGNIPSFNLKQHGMDLQFEKE